MDRQTPLPYFRIVCASHSVDPLHRTHTWLVGSDETEAIAGEPHVAKDQLQVVIHLFETQLVAEQVLVQVSTE